MDCYILHTVLLVIILLFIIAIICYHYAELRSKKYIVLKIQKSKIMDLKKLILKIVHIILSMT